MGSPSASAAYSPPMRSRLMLAGRAACRHRPERRRQDHADRPTDRRNQTRCRDASVSTGATSPCCRFIAAAQLGLARSFQITSLFNDFTALDNVALAVQAHRGHSFRFWRAARQDAALREPARAALGRVGLAGRADVSVSRMSHGEQRQLEIAMALATRPRMLLLDEPMAGMGPDESSRMVRLLRALKREAHHPACRARHGGGVRACRSH